MIHDVKISSGEHYNVTGGVCNIEGTNYNIVQGYTPISESGTLVMKDILFENSAQSVSIIDSSSLTSDTLVKGSIQLASSSSWSIGNIDWTSTKDKGNIRCACFQSPQTGDSVSNMQTGLWTGKQYSLSSYNTLNLKFYRSQLQGQYAVYVFISPYGDYNNNPNFIWYGGDVRNASMSGNGVLLKKYLSSGRDPDFETLTNYWTTATIDISSYTGSYSIGIASVCDTENYLMAGICLADLSLS